MGGRGSGGARVGAGRKSKSAKRRVVGNDVPPQMRSVEPDDVLPPPPTLSPGERAIWIELAPHATAAGTLEPSTAEDFAVLAALTVEATELLAARRAAGWTSHGFKLATHYRNVVQRLESKMRGFKLAPIGKPMRPVSIAEPDEFAEFDVPLPMRDDRWRRS